MLEDHALTPGSTALATGSVAGAGAAEATLPLDRVVGRGGGFTLPRIHVRFGTRSGIAALTAIVIGVFTVVVFASAGPSLLVPHSGKLFPAWEAGPFGALLGHPSLDPTTLMKAYSALLAVMTIAYLVALAAARSLPMRVIAVAVVALHLIILLSPPLQLTDAFNYLGYARLGGLHALNPYSHVIDAESWDPVYRFTTWHNLASPYGPLFTLLTYPLAWLPLPLAYWLLKIGVVASALCFTWLVWKCATLLEIDPRPAVAFVALSPLYLFFALGGFHNDFLMLLPSTAAIMFVLQRRDKAAGVALAAAVAVKFTAVLLLPFLVIASRSSARRLRVIGGFAAAGVAVLGVSLAVLGTSLPNISDQTGVVTGFSIPNLVGLALGFGGSTPFLLHVATLGIILVVLIMLRRPRQWIAGAGWSTLALVASLAWLMPWYLVWVLPLAALGRSAALRRVTLVFTVFLVLTFSPETGVFIDGHGLDPMATSAGRAAMAIQQKLQK